MVKSLLLFIAFLIYCGSSVAQKIINISTIHSLYAAKQESGLKKTDTTGYLLIQVKDPKALNLKKVQAVKRISYDTYVIKTSPNFKADKNVLSAVTANSMWKATDNLVQIWQQHPDSKRQLIIKLTLDGSATVDHLTKYGNTVQRAGNNIIFITTYNSLPALLSENGVNFANNNRKAHDETPIPDIDLGSGNITAVADNYPDINGQGINVAIKENLYDVNDLDIAGRTFRSFTPSSTISQHATDMATLIGGGGNSYIQGLGAAPNVNYTSSTYDNLSADTTSIFITNKISAQNHSYGTGIENYYNDESLSYDQQVNDDDTLVHVFSSGNVGTTAPTSGVYNGLTGYANITGAFKQAKNIIVAGGLERNNSPSGLSSAGPAFDGRLIPQVVTDGEDGTSGAAALTSGTVVLMQQAYKKQYGRLPSAALVKSILINSADDIGNAAIDFKTGYGKLNALEAIRTINDGRFDAGSVAHNQQADISYTVPAGTSLLKISLAWDDLPAAINTTKALVNDLDLSVSAPDGSVILPWILSTYPSADSLAKAAIRGKDTLNTAEQVTIQNPAAGTYIIHVKGSNIPAGSQAFYVAKQVVAANKFEWIYPAGNDRLFAADTSYLRWQNTYANAQGILSVSYDHGTTWAQIASAKLKNKYFAWYAPDVFTTAILKMTINGADHVSKEFSISKPINPNVGYNCTGGTLLHWQPQAGATGYAIYNIKNNLLQQLTTTADTSAIITTAQQASNYFAVSALGQGFEGIKSYTFDATQQGVGCYIRTLLATVSGKTIVLDLNLGSVLGLKSITWQKLTGIDRYTDLATSSLTASLDYKFTDTNPVNGIQYYRAKLITTDNSVIYSDQASAVYLQPNQFAVFPNPVKTQLNVISGDVNDYTITMYNALGKLSLTQPLENIENTVPVNLASGIYIYVISLKGKALMKGKLVKL